MWGHFETKSFKVKVKFAFIFFMLMATVSPATIAPTAPIVSVPAPLIETIHLSAEEAFPEVLPAESVTTDVSYGLVRIKKARPEGFRDKVYTSSKTNLFGLRFTIPLGE